MDVRSMNAKTTSATTSLQNIASTKRIANNKACPCCDHEFCGEVMLIQDCHPQRGLCEACGVLDDRGMPLCCKCHGDINNWEMLYLQMDDVNDLSGKGPLGHRRDYPPAWNPITDPNILPQQPIYLQQTQRQPPLIVIQEEIPEKDESQYERAKAHLEAEPRRDIPAHEDEATRIFRALRAQDVRIDHSLLSEALKYDDELIVKDGVMYAGVKACLLYTSDAADE